MIKAILACDEDGGVSRDGTLPWPKNSVDLKWFKENTVSDVVVMGSTTWNDPHMPRPLPKRTNVLVTSKLIDHPEATHVISGDLVSELQLLKNQYAQQTIWVIGGPNIVNQCLSCIEEFYISRIPGFHSCDTFLPINRIETMFELDWYQEHPTVRFEIWKNLDSQN